MRRMISFLYRNEIDKVYKYVNNFNLINKIYISESMVGKVRGIFIMLATLVTLSW